MSAKNEKWDIMVSYNWTTGKECADELDELLTKCGYKVWIDKKNMAGNLCSDMAKGITNSEIILLLISEEYEKPDNCMSEYTYANSCKNKVIPIQVKDYLPPRGSGLNLIMAGKIYYQLYKNKDDNMKWDIKRNRRSFRKKILIKGTLNLQNTFLN